MGEPANDMETLCKKVSAMSLDRLGLLKTAGVRFKSTRITKETLYYVPAGWLVIEQALADSPLIYGIRKSYFIKTPATIEAYKTANNWLAQGGQCVSKMDSVLALLQG